MVVLLNENERVRNDFVKFIKDSASLFNIHIDILKDDESNKDINKMQIKKSETFFNIWYDDEDANYGQI